jgi:predicted class III extradiol MEMO1 family dioxygenase
MYALIFVLMYFEISLVYGELWKTGMFERMSLQTDEDEHSIEMHLPYTAKAMERYID